MLTKQHLGPLVQAFKQALHEGVITLEEASDFCVATYDAFLDARVALQRRDKGNTDGKLEETTSKEV